MIKLSSIYNDYCSGRIIILYDNVLSFLLKEVHVASAIHINSNKFCLTIFIFLPTGMSKYETSIPDVLKFITGCTEVPPLGFSKKITISFIHRCKSGCKCCPKASTCALERMLPTHIKSFEDIVSCGGIRAERMFWFW